MMELGLASWETIARRTLMMSRGACSAAEYQRMVQEKMAALSQTMALLSRPGGLPNPAALIAPWHRKATANARRLRRRSK